VGRDKEDRVVMIEALLIVLILVVGWAALEVRLLRRSLRLALCGLLLEGAAQAQPKREFVGPPRPTELRKLATPAEAQTLALADLLSLPENQRPLIRYLWLREPSVERVKSITLDLNRVSRSASIFRPVPLEGNRLLRVDLQAFTDDTAKELQQYLDAWELLRFDPSFNLLLTPDALKVVLGIAEDRQPRAVVREGKTFRETKLSELKEQTVVRLNAGHLDPTVTAQLQAETLSAAPIVEANYFRFRALNSIQDDGPFKEVFGGLYYDLLGLRKLAGKGQTDLAALLKFLGAEEPTAEQRVGMARSLVTGKPRAISFFPARSRGVLDGRAAVVVTEDPKDKSIDHSQNAMLTLDRRFFKPDAKEVIWTMKNGLNGYGLYDGNDKLQDEAPPDVVADTTVPAPHSKRLQAASSCLRCHEAEGSDGWKPASNDVLKRLRRGLDIFGDAKDPNRPIADTIRSLSAQYKAEPDRFLKDARNDLQGATLEATGPWEGNSPPTALVKLAAKQYESDTLIYWYGEVTPDRALRELGFEAVPKEQAVVFLRRLLRPDVESAAFGIVPEDLRIGSLVTDFSVNRVEWSFVYAFAQFRAQRELGRMAREQGPKPREVRP
jgi:hypothetical protein